MTDARSPPLTYADLERRYTGPIPQEALDRLRYGSSLNAEIAETEGTIAFYRDQIVRMRPSAKRWRARGNLGMARLNIADSWFYLRQWRALRARLAELRGANAAVQGAGRFFDALSPKGQDDG